MKELILNIALISALVLLIGFIFSVILYTIFGKGAVIGPSEPEIEKQGNIRAKSANLNRHKSLEMLVKS